MIRAAARRFVTALGELAEVVAAICAPDEPVREAPFDHRASREQPAGEATVGSIRVERRPGGNLEIDTTHTRGGLIRQGAVVVERADARDLIDALELVVGPTDDASSWPERCVVENGSGRRCNGKHWHAEAHDFSATGPGVNRWRGGPYADRDPAPAPVTSAKFVAAAREVAAHVVAGAGREHPTMRPPAPSSEPRTSARRPDADRPPCPTCGQPLTAIDPALVDKSGDLGCELGHRWNSLSLSGAT